MSGRERSLAAARRRYMLGDEPAAWPAANAPLWQIPLLTCREGDSAECIGDRIQRAGTLWLQNYDLSFLGTLIITCPEIPLCFVFRRAFAVDEPYCVVGPAELDPVPEAGEVRLPWGLVFRFRESG